MTKVNEALRKMSSKPGHLYDLSYLIYAEGLRQQRDQLAAKVELSKWIVDHELCHRTWNANQRFRDFQHFVKHVCR